MVNINRHYNYYDVRGLLGITDDAKRDEHDFAKLTNFISGMAVLLSVMKDNQLTTAAMQSLLVDKLTKLDLRMSGIENQLTSSRVTDSDDLYVTIEEVARLSGYERKRCKQLMLDAIANGDIRVNQVTFVNKAGNESHTRCRYHLGDCKRFWSPARVKKAPVKKTAARKTVTA